MNPINEERLLLRAATALIALGIAFIMFGHFCGCTYDACERACQLHADYMLECERVAICWNDLDGLTDPYPCESDEYLAQCYEMWWVASEPKSDESIEYAQGVCDEWSWNGDCSDWMLMPMPLN